MTWEQCSSAFECWIYQADIWVSFCQSGNLVILLLCFCLEVMISRIWVQSFPKTSQTRSTFFMLRKIQNSKIWSILGASISFQFLADVSLVLSWLSEYLNCLLAPSIQISLFYFQFQNCHQMHTKVYHMNSIILHYPPNIVLLYLLLKAVISIFRIWEVCIM